MNNRVWRLTTVSTLALVSLVFLTACVCWPSLPTLIHQNGCARIYPSESIQYAAPPPKSYIAHIHNQDVWIMEEDGTQTKQLTESAEREFSLSASERVERIWFIRSNSPSASTNLFGDVYSCDYEGKNVKQVTEGLMVRFAVVSNDGKKLAISVIGQAEAAIDGVVSETADMYIISASADKLTSVDAAVDLSSDLAATGVGGREGSTFLAWSPDSKRVAFTYKADGSASLGISTKSVYLADADGDNRQKLIDSCDEPRFNTDGTMLAVTHGSHWDTTGVMQVSVDGDFSEDILPMPTGSPLYSAYSPFWLTTYYDVAEHVNVVYSKQTHPADASQIANTLEIYNLETEKTTVLATMSTPSEIISRIDNDALNSYLIFQAGVSDPVSGKAAAIWRLKPDGTDLTKLSGEGDYSEPTFAVSYSWYNKGKTGGTTNPYGCHWPYENYPQGYNGALL